MVNAWYDGWFSEPIQKLGRSWLDGKKVSEWPKPDATCKGCLFINTPEPVTISNACEALEAALTRPDIDTLLVGATCFWHNEEVRDLFRRLLSQDRDWRAIVRFGNQVGNQERLDILAIFTPVRYLNLIEVDRRMLPLLNSFPKLVELDLSNARLVSTQFGPLFEDEQLAKKLAHVHIWLYSSDDDWARFPVASRKHLRSLTCTFRDGGYSPGSFLDFSREISRLEALKYLNLCGAAVETDLDHSEAIETLSVWIGSPSCGLTHLSIEWFNLPSSLKMIQAIGRNCSIQELSMKFWLDDLNWATDVLPAFTKSSVHHFMIRPKPSQEILGMLRKWMLQMRPTRLISIDHTFFVAIGESRNITRLSRLHVGLKRISCWQSSLDCSFLPGCLWIRSLGRCPPLKWSLGPEEIETILDTTFFLLRRWATGISTVPRHHVSLKRQTSSST